MLALKALLQSQSNMVDKQRTVIEALAGRVLSLERSSPKAARVDAVEESETEKKNQEQRHLTESANTASMSYDGSQMTLDVALTVSGNLGTADITATSLTDGTATMTGGALSGLTSVAATSLTDGTATMKGGALSGLANVTVDKAIETSRSAYAFQAVLGASSTGPGTLVFQTLEYGGSSSAYSTTTGTYTAPVTGLYWFNVMVESSSTNAASLQVYKNGVGTAFYLYFGQGIVSGTQASNSGILSLSVGDLITVYTGSAISLWSGAAYGTCFSGFLIGATA